MKKPLDARDLRNTSALSPVREASVAEVLAKLTPDMDERQVPLNARGGLLGLYGFGPNPAREALERMKQNDE